MRGAVVRPDVGLDLDDPSGPVGFSDQDRAKQRPGCLERRRRERLAPEDGPSGAGSDQLPNVSMMSAGKRNPNTDSSGGMTLSRRTAAVHVSSSRSWTVRSSVNSPDPIVS